MVEPNWVLIGIGYLVMVNGILLMGGNDRMLRLLLGVVSMILGIIIWLQGVSL